MSLDPPGFIKGRVLAGLSSNKPSLDSSELFLKKAMDIAKAPLSSLFMRVFMMWMIGNSVNIFTIFAIYSALKDPVKALADTNTAFEGIDHGGISLIGPKIIYVLLNLVGLGIGLYKLATMGLLPVTSADWHGLLTIAHPVEFSAGGLALGG